MEDHEAIDREINLPTTWRRTTEGKAQVSATMSCATLRDVANRENQMRWFNTHINAYVNALRLRIAQFAEELLEVRST
jgi:hypothetical protein